MLAEQQRLPSDKLFDSRGAKVNLQPRVQSRLHSVGEEEEEESKRPRPSSTSNVSLSTSRSSANPPTPKARTSSLSSSLGNIPSDQILKQGYLLKKGHKRRNWTRRWFELRADKILRYMVQPGDKTHKGEIIITPDTQVERAKGLHKAVDHPFCIQITQLHKISEFKNKKLTVVTTQYVFYMDAASMEEMTLWIQALRNVQEM